MSESPAAFVTDDRRRAVSASTGIPLRRSGQGIDDGFIESIFKSYTNLVNRPHIMLFLFLLSITFVAEYLARAGPLEFIVSTISAAVDDTSIPHWERIVLSSLHKVFVFLVNNKIRFIEFGFLSFPYAAKPSWKNLIVALSFMTILLFIRTWPLWDVVLLSQLFFLFTQLRNPTHKFFIVLVTVLLFYVGIELASSVSPPTSSTTPSTATTRTTTAKPKS